VVQQGKSSNPYVIHLVTSIDQPPAAPVVGLSATARPLSVGHRDINGSVKVDWDQVRAWRLRRQYVDPCADVSAAEVVTRLCGLQAQVASAAVLAVGLRQTSPNPDEITQGIADGSLVKSWVMRGTLHLCDSSEVAGYLSLLAATRIWARPVWQRTFGASVDEVARLTEKVATILEGRVLTRDELVSEIVADKRFTNMEQELRSGWGALLKPLAWQGALCYGPNRGRLVTFTSPASLVPDWQGSPEPDEAAPAVIASYLSAYGPSTPEAFDAWLTRGSHRKTTVRRWFHDLGDRLAEVDIEGHRAFLPVEHVDDLAASEPSGAVRLLGAFDQYVLGPGTKDTQILASQHRAKVSRTAGWISPIVVAGGRIVGVWEISGTGLVVSMFEGEKAPPMRILRDEAARVAEVSGLTRLDVTL
jgi:hypothetical protein